MIDGVNHNILTAREDLVIDALGSIGGRKTIYEIGVMCRRGKSWFQICS